MIKTTFKCSLDIHDIYSQFSLPIKKGDTSGRLIITLMENGKPYPIPEGCYAVLAGTKADKSIIHHECTVQVQDNAIVYHMNEQTTSSAGKIECEVILYGESGRAIVSPRFTIMVHDSAYSEEEVENSNEYTSLTNLISSANKLINEVTDKFDNGLYHAGTADHATEADHAVNADHAVDADNATEANHAVNADLATEATHADKARTADYADQANYALEADEAENARYAIEANHAKESDIAKNAYNAQQAESADEATNATEANHAKEADHAINADHAVNADSVGFADFADDAKHTNGFKFVNVGELYNKKFSARKVVHAYDVGQMQVQSEYPYTYVVSGYDDIAFLATYEGTKVWINGVEACLFEIQGEDDKFRLDCYEANIPNPIEIEYDVEIERVTEANHAVNADNATTAETAKGVRATYKTVTSSDKFYVDTSRWGMYYILYKIDQKSYYLSAVFVLNEKTVDKGWKSRPFDYSDSDGDGVLVLGSTVEYVPATQGEKAHFKVSANTGNTASIEHVCWIPISHMNVVSY